jgi:hypothetical protein
MDFPWMPAGLYHDLFSQALFAEAEDGSLWIRSAPARYVAWVAAFLVLVPLSRWCWNRKIATNLAKGFFFASFLIPVLIIPGLAAESVHIAREELTIKTGFWFDPTIHRVPLEGVTGIVEYRVSSRQRSIHRKDRYWEFRCKSVKPRRIKLPDLLDATREEAKAHLRKSGFTVIERPEM